VRFIDLFAGIGGNRLAFEQVGGKCVFCCEIDENNRKTYEVNFGERPYGDIREIEEHNIPDHDILITGVPVQRFTLSKNNCTPNKTSELSETLFYEIARVLRSKRPRAFLIETIKVLNFPAYKESFDNMIRILNDLGYQIHYQLINAKGLVPQSKERLYIVGFQEKVKFEFPHVPQQGPALKTILEEHVDEKYTISDRECNYIQHKKRRPTQSCRLANLDSNSGALLSTYYLKPNILLEGNDGRNPRRLTPRECARLQGFPEEFVIPVSDSIAYRQFGASSLVPVVSLIAREIVQALKLGEVTSFQNTRMKKQSIKFETEEHLMNFTRRIIGKSFKEIDKLGILQGSNNNDKGRLGKVVETGFYGYELNNRCEADFDELGIELKVSGFNVLQDGSWSAKERVSLTMINYKKIIHEEFEFSKLIFKNRKLLIIWYEYVKGVPYEEFVIRDFQLYDMSIDEQIIRNDFYLIKQMVEDGRAHELSEGNSVILGAATKGQKGQTAEQPKSPIPAPTRAFSLKNSFFRGVLRDHVLGISRNNKSIDFVTPERFVWEKLKPYKGMSQINILNHFMERDEAKVIPKNVSKMVSDRVVGKDINLPKQHEVFSKSNFLIRNIPIKEDNTPLEKATFSTLQISDFTTPWEESEWKSFFEEVTFIYIAYIGEKNGRELKNGYRILDRIFKVTFTAEEVEEFGKTYNMIKRTIDEKNTKLLPTASSDLTGEHKLVIAPKGNAGGVYDRFLDDNRETCFMLNKDFLHKKFNEALTLY
jgi:DNA mismatch repair protein MutH